MVAAESIGNIISGLPHLPAVKIRVLIINALRKIHRVERLLKNRQMSM
jgi:hypothetical protein